jgi:rhamnosyltransferase subunit B
MSKKIVLATIGSLGDVHPFIALGHALKARGFSPVLAVPKDNVEKVERAGLPAHAILPGFAEMQTTLGMSEEESTRRMMRDPDFLVRRLFTHYLADSAKALDEICDDASAIVSTMFALAGPIVAEARGLPLIPVMLQPMAMMSAFDPPQTPDFWMMAQPPVGKLRLGWNRMFLRLIKTELRRRYAGQVNRVRRAYGLPPARLAPIFQGPPPDARCVIGFYSEVLAPRQPDYPDNTVITGFPQFDSNSGAPETLDAELENFLTTGEAPIVFTLGSFAVHAPGKFYTQSIDAARELGRRALLLTGPGNFPSAPDVLARPYAPHSLVFPHAAIVVHHGGVGTTGAAMRAGKPQLVVPHMGDQADHGARIQRLGLGYMLPANRYRAGRAAAILRRILADPAIARRAERVSQPILAENGAGRAAEAITLALAS